MLTHTKRNFESLTSIAKVKFQFRKKINFVPFKCIHFDCMESYASCIRCINFQTFYVWFYNSADVLHQTVLLSFLLKCFRSIIVSVHNNICTLAFHTCCVTLKKATCCFHSLHPGKTCFFFGTGMLLVFVANENQQNVYQ